MTDRHPRRGNGPRSRRRPSPAAPEALEGRQLLAYTPLGFSIPDLAILDAFTGPVGAYGGPIAVTVDVSNLGQSSIPEPLAQFPGSTSTADAGPSQVAVFYTSRVHSPFGGRILLGTIGVPAIPQNRLARVSGTFTLPAQPPAGFPVTGENGFISVEIDPTGDVRDLDRTNNILRPAADFLLVPNLPQLQAIDLGLPAGLSPGDTFVPQVKIANYGAAPTAAQAPVVVQIVASIDPVFGPGDEILGTFTVDNIDPLSVAPTKNFVPGDSTLADQPNIVTLVATQPVALPVTGAPYFVGVVIDPLNQITEIDELGRGPDPTLELVREVTASGLGLPPAGLSGDGQPSNLPFPFPAYQTPTGTPPVATEPSPVIIRGGELRRNLAERQALLRSQGLRPIDGGVTPRVRPGALAARLAARRSLRGI